ncbi:MAG TPA: SDR family oxidoreductase, partial [Aquabacterium sp.]|nr:SDR family oxidoreductase [Aquabacterium sp.]
VVANNLTGGFLMAREVFNQSMHKHGGAIVNMVADMWNGMPGMGHSGAARAGMVNLTKTAAYEWSGSNVRVNAVAPGWIASSGMDAYGPGMAGVIRSLKDNTPMKRMGLEAEVSAVICFLLSPGAAFVTGVTIPIDGGAPLNSPLYPIADHAPAPTFDGFHRATQPKVLQGL